MIIGSYLSNLSVYLKREVWYFHYVILCIALRKPLIRIEKQIRPKPSRSPREIRELYVIQTADYYHTPIIGTLGKTFRNLEKTLLASYPRSLIGLFREKIHEDAIFSTFASGSWCTFCRTTIHRHWHGLNPSRWVRSILDLSCGLFGVRNGERYLT